MFLRQSLLLLLPVAGTCTQTANGQMRQIYLDTFQENNTVRKISFLAPVSGSGWIAYRNWLGYTTDSGRTYSKKFITNSNVNYNGYTNVNLTFGFAIKGVKAIAPNMIIVYGDYGFVPAILMSQNTGASFTLVYHSQFDPLQVRTGITDMVFPQDGPIGYAVDADRILKTTNGGYTWTTTYTDPGRYFSNLEAVDDNNVFAFSTDFTTNKLLRTTNTGSTWQAVTLPPVPNGKIAYAQFLTATKGWLSLYDPDNNAYFYKTPDAGTTWNLQNNIEATPFSCSKMKFLNDSTGYAISGLYTVYKTTNSGVLWEPLPRDNNYSYLNFSHEELAVYSANRLWAGGGHGFLEISTNGGGTPIPAAHFLVEVTNSPVTNTVNLINYSKATYQYRWFVNGALVSTNYNASYTHNPFYSTDTIRLITTNGSLSDTAERLQFFSPQPAPRLLSFSPAAATVGGVVTIKGTSLQTTTAVRFGSFPAASFSIVSDSVVNATLGNGETGYIVLTTRGGKDSISGFRFLPPPPTISSVTPTTVIPGSEISVYGSFLSGASSVTIGGAPVGGYRVISQNLIKVNVAGTPGTLVLTTPSGSASFNSITLLPIVFISSFSPSFGPVGTVITINGANFSPVLTNNVVWFGATKATVLSATATQLTVAAPAGATNVPVSVTVDSRTAYTNRPFRITFPNSSFIDTTSFVNLGNYSSVFSIRPEQAMVQDLNEDGKPEMLVQEERTAATYINHSTPGNVSLAYAFNIPTQSGVLPVFADLDGDGKQDMVTVNVNLSIKRNKVSNGNILFDTAIVLSPVSPYTTISFSIADIDGDRRPDIVACMIGSNYQPTYIAIYRNTTVNNVISFAPFEQFASLEYSFQSDIAIRDMDEDGRPDIVMNSSDGNSARHFSIYRNTSTPGLLSIQPGVRFDGEITRAMTADDFDGDGKTDLAFLSDRNPYVAFYRNASTGAGNFSFAPVVTVPVSIAYKIQAADFSGDGKSDIVIANASDHSTSILQNISTPGTIAFRPGVKFRSGYNTYPSDAGFGDLDGDGKTDLLYLNSYQSSWTTVFRNRLGEPMANAGPDTSICSGNAIQIGTPAVSGFTYSWTSIPAGFVSAVARPSVAPLISITYYLKVTNALGAIEQDTVVVNVQPLPVAAAGPDSTICSGTTIAIGTAAIQGYTYSWTSLPAGFTSTAANPSVSPTASTRYYLQTTNAIGCQSRDTAIITVVNSTTPSVTVSMGRPTACPGVATTFTAVQQNGGSTPAYQWKVNNVNAGGNSSFFSATTIPYGAQVKVVMTSSIACATPATVNSNTIVVIYQNRWMGTMSTAWENPANWSCGTVPDGNTDVLISSGSVVLNSNGICRTITVLPGASFTVTTGNVLTITH